MEKPANPAASGSPRPQVTLLNAGSLDRVCVRGHLMPSADLAPFVAVAWTMEWRLPNDQTFTQQVLPNPSVQIVVDHSGRAEVLGIVTGAFSTTLAGEGFVFGLRFRPCGFYPVVRQPVARFTNRRHPLTDVLPGVDSAALQRLARDTDKPGLMELLQGALRMREPRRDQIGASLEALIDRMEADPQMLTTDEAAHSFGASVRTLQRLFHQHVGVSPKWILRRFRLKEAAATIEQRQPINMSELAQRLGYYDQAHLNRDFRTLIGQPPATWARQQSGHSVG
ncbi:MAG: helix-turn-helix domain-containing protein [Bryobacteraceae bacterium]|nr:helix-turn-helix domain-containing protein [Bryobacteraceae bacterium]